MSAASRSRSPGPEGAGAGQGAGDLPLALVSLPLVLSVERCCLGIGGRGADEDAVDGSAPELMATLMRAKPASSFSGSGSAKSAATRGLVLHGEGFVVTGDGDVEQAGQDPSLEENSR